MKKRQLINLITLFLLAVCLSGCTPAKQESTPPPTATATQMPTPVPTPKKDIPDAIGLYIPDKAEGVRKLVTEYSAEWTKGTDIKCFEAFAVQENTISGGPFGEIWNGYWTRYQDADICKIGYCLYFTLTDGTSVSQVIKTPADTLTYKRYIETYLYDDAHQKPGVWYSHLEPEDMTEATVCTSIKLTAGEEIEKVKEIRLEAFLYSDAEKFNCYTISVKRKESA